ncbi:MAG: hypothetical protein JOY80_03705 [Candidatus Dormibacteraeota bacterium]|nr:hypothetical protein [Candidatus Dormibacteraeota bacterium]
MITTQQPSDASRATQSVVDLIDQLEAAVGGARRLPLSASVVVNEEDTLELIDRIRLALPDEVVQARQSLEDRDRMLATAEEEAERILDRAEQAAQRTLADANDRATALLAQHELTEQAQAHAEILVAESEERAGTVRDEADAYARDVMANLEEQLMRALTTVRRGIETLPFSQSRSRSQLAGRSEARLGRRVARH